MFATEHRRRSASLSLTPATLIFLVFTLGPAFLLLYISLFRTGIFRLQR